jgi:hypothetical protein
MNGEKPIRSDELVELDVVYVSAVTRFRTMQYHEDVVGVDVNLRYRTTDGTVIDRPLVQSKASGQEQRCVGVPILHVDPHQAGFGE